MQLNVALIRMVFLDRSASDLREVLKQARSRGADLAVLPELPLNVWSPASKVVQNDEAEPPAGAPSSSAAQSFRMRRQGAVITRHWCSTGRERSLDPIANCTSPKRRASGRPRIMIPVMSHHL